MRATQVRKEMSSRLRELNLEFNGEMFLGARLYTGRALQSHTHTHTHTMRHPSACPVL